MLVWWLRNLTGDDWPAEPSGLDGGSVARVAIYLDIAQAACDHIVWWLGRRVVAATTQVRLLVWSDFSISAVLGLSWVTKTPMAMTAQLCSVSSDCRRSWAQSAAAN